MKDGKSFSTIIASTAATIIDTASVALLAFALYSLYKQEPAGNTAEKKSSSPTRSPRKTNGNAFPFSSYTDYCDTELENYQEKYLRKHLESTDVLPPNASAEALGVALTAADIKTTILILQHPNANDISIPHLDKAVFTPNEEKRGLIFQYIEKRVELQENPPQLEDISCTEIPDNELINFLSRNTSRQNTPEPSKESIPSSLIQSPLWYSSLPTSPGYKTSKSLRHLTTSDVIQRSLAYHLTVELHKENLAIR